MPRQRQSGEERRRQIVDAALDLLARRGPAAVTTAAIAARIGLTQGALFRHFPNKESLLTAALNRVTEGIVATMVRATERDAPATERLRAAVTGYLKFMSANPAMLAMFYARDFHARYPQIRDLISERIGRFRHRLAGVIRDGIVAGEFRADVDPDIAAGLIRGMIYGLGAERSLRKAPFDPVAEGGRMFDVLLSGLRAPPKPGRRPSR